MLIKNARYAAAVLALVIFAIPAAQAQQTNTADQNVVYSVASIQRIALTGSPALHIIDAVAGAAKTSITDATASYAIWTNGTDCKITASLDANMGTGLTLSANLVAPAAATSANKQSLSTVAVEMVTGITKVSAPILGITYTLDALPTAGPVSKTAVVTYTVTAGG